VQLDHTGTKSGVSVFKYGLVNCLEEVVVLSVSHDGCVGLMRPDTKLMTGI